MYNAFTPQYQPRQTGRYLPAMFCIAMQAGGVSAQYQTRVAGRYGVSALETLNNQMPQMFAHRASQSVFLRPNISLHTFLFTIVFTAITVFYSYIQTT